jgi:hypothetical protein
MRPSASRSGLKSREPAALLLEADFNASELILNPMASPQRAADAP